jgi:glycosyltransferase involved in cell wall biosynthesis
MRTLIVSAIRPYPPLSGSPLRVWHNIRVLATVGSVSVFSFGDRLAGATSMPGVERWEHIDYDEYPERTLSGIQRIRKLITPRQFPLPNDYITPIVNRRLAAFMKECAPDIVVLSNWTSALPDALRNVRHLVIDAHNIESELRADLLRGERGSLGLMASLEVERFRRRERRLFRHAERIWVCSAEDAILLKHLVSRAHQSVIWPNVIEVESYVQVRSKALRTPAAFERTAPTIVFVGYFHYAPNREAAETLIDDIFPRVVRQLSDARLVLVGREPSQRMLAAAARDARIVVTGAVDDTRPYLRLADVCAVPLHAGGGTRLKILEAFASGIPVVSTSKGIEGIAAVNGRDVVIADDRDAFASAIVDILSRPDRYRAQSDAALDLARRAYSLGTLERLLPLALPDRGAAKPTRTPAETNI